ncbi:TMAO reductase system periplasmic protein TorT [Vibrio kyushuensis]|uniref:TMAO reductase system periplasmic protein TorT n=1 Tax=Vibrio kyushuensis TaxID=2910249 RepID=UPI003D0B65D7
MLNRKQSHKRIVNSTLCAAITFGLFTTQSSLAEEVSVGSYYGNYDVTQKSPGQQSLSLRGPIMETWALPAVPDKKLRIGISIPHVQDSYWHAVNYGLTSEAERLNVEFVVKEAGGYSYLNTQQQQLNELVELGVDGIILGSISYSGNNELVQQIDTQGIPVIEVINDIEAQSISAKSIVSFYDMGYLAGEYVANDAEEAGKNKVNVIFLPGPKNSGWADDSFTGFQSATDFFPGELNVVAVEWGDTSAKAQGDLLANALAAHPDVDYVIGNAVAAELAPAIISKSGQKSKVIGTYITPALYKGITNGTIAAAPADMTVDQARIAMGMMIRLLKDEKPGTDFPFRAGPLIPVLSKSNITDYSYEKLFGPKDYSVRMDNL